ncbi:hypothetical protein PoB_003197400 [Plakobranchus ocellatus]|uniref:Uncharacterized protein n=1 Tax=Plakobranchus ocellatus TaxID=259542 RepID=A0AAV4AGB8_9GAST|nr:hypothetical protein PoB_003197400 [Plakobranchus ocellatus]
MINNDMDTAYENLKDLDRHQSPQQGDLRLSGPPSGQGAGSGARTRDKRVPADLRAYSQASVLPTPPKQNKALPVGILFTYIVSKKGT